jgi:hypothetical protein
MKSYTLIYAAREMVNEKTAKEIIKALVNRAKHGDVRSAELLFKYLVGLPCEMKPDEEQKARPINVVIHTTPEPPQKP